MTDIVDWLRRFKKMLIKSDASKPEGAAVTRIAEAADEIERLRAMVAALQAQRGLSWQEIAEMERR